MERRFWVRWKKWDPLYTGPHSGCKMSARFVLCITFKREAQRERDPIN